MVKTYDLYHIKDKSETKNNVYVIVDQMTRKAAVVDPACSLQEINEMIKNLNLALDAILVTHIHPDHIGSVDDLIKQHQCKVYVSKKEAHYYAYHCKNIQLFEDQEMIDLGHTLVKCILTPGHTAGSTCFLLENSLFSGDTIFMEGCGICTEPGGSALDMFSSILKIKQQVAESVLVYPGHTYGIQPGQSIVYLKAHNIYFVIENQQTFVEFRMRKNQKNLFNFE